MRIYKLLFKILNKKNKINLFFLIFLSLIGMLLEIIGVGMIMPLLIILSQGTTTSPEINNFLSLINIDFNDMRNLIFILLFLICFFFIKFLFLLFLTFKQNTFVYKLQAHLSSLMFRGYLLSPYTFHLKRNSSELIRNVIVEIAQFSGAILALLVFVTELFVLTGIIALLLFVEPIGAFASFVIFGLSALLFDNMSKKYVRGWGFERQKYEGERLKVLNQGLNAYKEIILSRTEKVFVSQFQKQSSKIAEMEIKSNVLSGTPRLGLELIAVITLFTLIFILLNRGNSLYEIIPTIGFFGVAAFRIMPSINRLINTGQVVRYHFSVIVMLDKEFSSFSTIIGYKNSKKLEINDIAIEDLSFKYEKNKNFTLENVNLKIFNNEFVGIIGGSGAGKSTLVSLILGLLEPNKGQIKNNNKSIFNNITQWQNEIGYVPQEIYLLDDSIRNNIAFGIKSSDINEKKLKNSIKLASLDSVLIKLPQGDNTRIGEKGVFLSGGQRQRIGLARALYNQPQLLILDEATSALDSNTEDLIIKNLKNLEFRPTIIMITHRKNSLELCDNVYEFNKKTLEKK